MLPNLKTFRKKAGISQQALADAIGVSQQSINQYENHTIEPDIAVLSRIADFFHTTIDSIVGREGTNQQTDDAISYPLTKQEIRLIEQYRALKPFERECVDIVMRTLWEK